MHQPYPGPAQPYPMTQPAPMQMAQPAAGGVELENIKASLDRLTGKLQGIVQAQSTAAERPTGRAAENSAVTQQFDRISEELSWLREAVTNIAAADPVKYDLDGLNQVIDANYNALCEQVGRIANSNADPLAYAQAVETSHNGLSGQIEELKQALSAGTDSANATPQDFSSLESRLEEITRAVMALSAGGSATKDGPNDGLERIEARLAGLTSAIDTIVADAVIATPGQTDPAITGLLSELQKSLAAIDSRVSNIAPASEGILDGMAAQLNRLSEKLDNIGVVAIASGEQADSSDDGALIGRLDQLVERVEALNSGAADPTSMVAIESQLDRLSGEMESLRGGLANGGSTAGDETFANAVLEHLQHITNRVDQLDPAGSGAEGDSALASLEQQISSIASQLSSVGSPSVSLGPIEERLDGIEQQLGASRDIAIELATQVAEEAVAKTVSALPQGGDGAPSVDADAINALAEDLRALNTHTQDANSNSLQTIDAVRSTLEAIVERLGNIETRVGEHQLAASTQQFAPDADYATSHFEPEPSADHRQVPSSDDTTIAQQMDAQSSLASSDGQFSTSLDPQGGNMPEVQAPDLSMGEMPEVTSGVSIQEEDSPIEPGSGAPDLAALVRQANQRRRENPQPDEASPGTDFIAAARRAAQAAAAEAEAVQEEAAETSKKAGWKKIPDILKKRKKVLVIAAAAVLMIAVALPLASRFMNGGETTISSAPTPIVEVEPTALAEAGASPESASEAAVNEEDASEPQLDTEPVELVTPAPVVMPEAKSDEQPKMAGSSEETQPASAEASEAPTEFKVSHDISFGSDALKQAITAGNPSALFEIGRRYTDGVGVDRDLAEAAKWYKQAALLGFAPAQYRIGNFYEKGHGLEQDAVKAAEWYEKAANSGNIIAMHNLAVLHAEGKINGKQDMGSAFEWFKKAAEYGVRDSQVNIGIFYTNGVGAAEQNLVEAYKWFAVAAKAGDSDASGKRDVIANAMRPDQLEQARAETELWKPKTHNKDANSVTVPDSWKDDGPKTAAALSKQEMLMKTQVMLAKLGFDPGPADGLMGNKTRNAIMAFQQRSGMPVDGEFSTKLLDALNAVSI